LCGFLLPAGSPGDRLVFPIHSLWMYTMNRCFSVLIAGLSLAFAVSVASAQTARRDFPKNALRAMMVVTSPPQITLNGTAERLSPGARIKGTSNTLLMSGTLVGQQMLVNYVRDPQGMIHEVWVLSDVEAQEKRDGMSLTNIIFGSSADKPKADDGKTPFDQLPKYPAQ